ncbi:nitroreductase family deazaflavin-dependent oxidoreductase [Nonomuraea phyllanthi]|uniref:nitroreductase/quinone reductase family protein n=1 Tax=Nonomuraea phyllanthi TaxID=2219224 RepID=UPI001293F9EC|nr:nitroreductase/quinone reductase family protein [Nonomuraea phyllanthi]QFY09043.1 nitroreductase family deazaflavin-dependent oxidoreductase [Nonomuraea phyllanthi]
MPHDFNQQIIQEFRARGGKVGGPFEGARLLLLTTTGARSGARHTVPLGYLHDGAGRVLVIASAGGAPRHPAWYHNLRAHPRVTVETGAHTGEAEATVLEGEERDRFFARAVEADRGWADYEARSGRVLPVVALTPVSGAFPGPDAIDAVETLVPAGPDDHAAVMNEIRALMSQAPPLPAGADPAPALPRTGGVPGRWVNATERSAGEAGVLLYVHGGGFEQTQPELEPLMAYRLSQAAGRPAFNMDQRLAPAHPYPAALDDVVAVHRSLLDQGVPAGRVILSGESSGATLVLSALLALKQAGVPLPGAAVAVSPLTDLTLSSPSLDANDGRDVVGRPVVEHITTQYLAGAAADRAPQSPLHGDLRGLPPLLLVAGTREVLLDDARRFAAAASSAGVDVTLDLYEDMPHAFHTAVMSEDPPPPAATFLRRLAGWIGGTAP